MGSCVVGTQPALQKTLVTLNDFEEEWPTAGVQAILFLREHGQGRRMDPGKSSRCYVRAAEAVRVYWRYSKDQY